MTDEEIKLWIKNDNLLHRQWVASMMPIGEYITEYKENLTQYITNKKKYIELRDFKVINEQAKTKN
jgi:hypothetical protein